MRVAVLILSLMTCLFLFLQSAIVGGLSEEGSDENTAGAFGVLMSLMMLIGAAVVISVPRVATGIFLVVGAIGIIAGATSDFTDLVAWGVWSLILALFSYLGYRGKRKQQAKEAERDRIAKDALEANQRMAQQLAAMQQTQARYAPWPPSSAEQTQQR